MNNVPGIIWDYLTLSGLKAPINSNENRNKKSHALAGS